MSGTVLSSLRGQASGLSPKAETKAVTKVNPNFKNQTQNAGHAPPSGRLELERFHRALSSAERDKERGH